MTNKKTDETQDNDIDYKALYDDLKTTADSMESTLKSDISKLNDAIKERDEKINQLQTYICKNLSTDKPGKGAGSDTSSFEDRYKNALKDMNKK